MCSRSFKVIEFVTNRKSLCDFLLVVIVAYLQLYFARFWSYSDLLGKRCFWDLQLPHLTPSLVVIPCE